MSTIKTKTLRLVQLGLLSGLIILLQMYFVIPLPGSLTLSLVLVPIVVGAVLYGPGAGALLGGIFGLVVSIMAIQGQLGLLTNMMVAYNPLLTVTVCMFKGIGAGFVPGLIAKTFRKRRFAGILLAAAAAPIMNTHFPVRYVHRIPQRNGRICRQYRYGRYVRYLLRCGGAGGRKLSH